MSLSIKHATLSANGDDPSDPTVLGETAWNQDHLFEVPGLGLVGRSSAGAGAPDLISVGGGLVLQGGALGIGQLSIGMFNSGTGASNSTFWRGDGTWVAVPSAVVADPTAVIGLTTIVGSSTNAMRSDAAPALSQAIVPTWTGFHIFSAGAKALTSLSAGNPVFTAEASGAATNPSTVAQIKYNLSALASGDMVVYASGHATAPFGQVSTDTGLTGGLNLVAGAGQLLAQSTAAAVKIAGATGINFESPVGTAVGSYNGTVWGFLKPLSLTGILGNQITATSTNDGGTNSVIVGNGGTLANLNTVALLRASITSTANATTDLLVNGAASTPFGQLISGTALTGGLKINAGAGPITLTASNVSVPGTMSIGGAATHTEIVAPSTPSAGFVVLWADSTSANITAKNPAGTILAMVTPAAGAAHQFATAISAAGAISYAQPAFTDISGTLGSGQFGPLTGEVTTSGYAATITKSITPTWTGVHTFSAGLVASAASGSAPIVSINNLGSAASGANIALLKLALTAGSSVDAVMYVQGGASPILQINSDTGLTGGLNIVANGGQATFQSLTNSVSIIANTGLNIQMPTGTNIASYGGVSWLFSVPVAMQGVIGNQISVGSVATGSNNSVVIFNGGTATNPATTASIEVVLTSLAASDFIMSVSGAASNPFGLLETDTGLSGGLKIVADAGPVTLTGSQINTSKINTTGDITFSGNIHMPVTNLGGTTGVIFMGAQQFILVPTNNLFIGPAAGNLTLTEFENLGIGGGCLLHLTSGGQNTAINQLALAAMTSGSFNIGVGYNTMPSETTGSTNTAIGTEALLLQNGASNNVAVGFLAGQNITTGSNNVFVGTSAGGGITTGGNNVVVGVISGLPATMNHALVIADGGNNNLIDYNNIKANAWTIGNPVGATTAVDITLVGGSFTIRNNGQIQITNVGTNNFFAGHAAGNITNTGSGLSGFGNLTLNSIIDGTGNTAVGYVSSFGLTHGSNNTSVGASALQSETTGNSNVAVGGNALQNQVGAGGNTAVGINAGINVSTGSANTLLGENSGGGITTGHSNTILGANVTGLAGATSNTIIISDGDGNILADNNLTTAATWTFVGAVKFGTINTINLPTTTSLSVGTITYAGGSFISIYHNNVFLGQTAGNFTLTGTGNNGFGTAVHASLTTGSNNVTQGNSSSTAMTTGSNNSAIGTSAMTVATTGNNNTAIGAFSLSALIGGSSNAALGYQSGLQLTTGTSNTFLGNGTGQGITTGSQNTVVGANVFGLSAGLSNAIIIADGGTNVRIDYNFTTANVLTLLGTCAKFTLTGGLQMGAPTGGDTGAGSINVASGIFLNNTAYTNPDYALEHFFRSEIVLFAAPQAGGSRWGNERRRTYPGLVPLSELRDYIATNLRLPGIPDEPADIFERADMALEKIEEQAIYIVQLHERIAALEARLH